MQMFEKEGEYVSERKKGEREREREKQYMSE